jgi:uncharacterized protein (DUF58 family)
LSRTRQSVVKAIPKEHPKTRTIAYWVDWFADRFVLRNKRFRGDHELVQGNIYILPTKPGLGFALVIVLMLIGSINYALSLGYALTFLLASVGGLTMFHTYRNLAGLILRPGRAEAVFAGDLAEFNFIAVNKSKTIRHSIYLWVAPMQNPTLLDVGPAVEQGVSVAIPMPKRGLIEMPRLKLWSGFPFGIWKAWTYWPNNMKVLVYPHPESPAVPLPEMTTDTGQGTGVGKGEEDVASIRPYVLGDSPRRMAWKAMARTDDSVLTKTFEGGDSGELKLEWSSLPKNLDTESRLSRLTRWVIDAESLGARYSLSLPGFKSELDFGPSHKQQCLEAMAMFEITRAPRDEG